MSLANDDKEYRDESIPEEKFAYPVVKTKANSPYCSLKNRASVERIKHDEQNNEDRSLIQTKTNSSVAFIKPAKNIDSWINYKICATDVKPNKKASRYDYPQTSFIDWQNKLRACLSNNVQQNNSAVEKRYTAVTQSRINNAKDYSPEIKQIPKDERISQSMRFNDLKYSSAEKPKMNYAYKSKNISNVENQNIDITPEKKSATYRIEKGSVISESNRARTYSNFESDEKLHYRI